MEYKMSAGAALVGFMIIVAGALLMRFHRWAADNFGSGVSSYDRFKLYAAIACGVGVIVMFNLHAIIFHAIAGLFFGA